MFSLPGQGGAAAGARAGGPHFWGSRLEVLRRGLPVPSPRPGLDFPGGDSRRELWPTGELGFDC